jgi:hypothetical protein
LLFVDGRQFCFVAALGSTHSLRQRRARLDSLICARAAEFFLGNFSLPCPTDWQQHLIG